MFKHFLTHHFAISFERLCSSSELGKIPEREQLLRCSHLMVHHFDLAIRATLPLERAAALFVALTYLRDCGDILERAAIHPESQPEPGTVLWPPTQDSPVSPTEDSIKSTYDVLVARLERLFWESGGGENGQLRMLG